MNTRGCLGEFEHEISDITGIYSGETVGLRIKLYPNPATDYLNIEISSFNRERTIISIVDSGGRILQTYNFKDTENLRVNLKSFQNGIYTLLVISNKNVRHFQFVKR